MPKLPRYEQIYIEKHLWKHIDQFYDLWIESTKTFLNHLDHATNCKFSEKLFYIKWYIVVELLTKTTKIVANKYLARPVDCSNPQEASNQLYQHCNAHALFWFELTKHVFHTRWFISNWIYSEMCNSSWNWRMHRLSWNMHYKVIGNITKGICIPNILLLWYY